MVHARAFAFTDDSLSVGLPAFTALPTSDSIQNSSTGPHSMETALLLFQLRQKQSAWYQELFQSSRTPLPEGLTYIWRMCQEMREWSDSLPNTLPPAFKEFFDLELLYSYVYCLAPSIRVPAVSDYGKALIFEYSMAYMQKIYAISRDSIHTAFYTYHDALRVYFIGSQFLAVLAENEQHLLNGPMPYATAIPGSPPPPSLPNSSPGDKVDRSINCIIHAKETLKSFGRRWDDSKALESSFDMQADSVLAILHAIKRHGDQRHRTGTGQQAYMQRPGYDQMGNPIMGDWSTMNAVYANPNNLQGGHIRPARGL